MATVTLPYTLTAGTPENVNNLVSNLNALVTGVNTIDTAQIAASAVTTAEVADAAITAAKLAPGVGGTALVVASVSATTIRSTTSTGGVDVTGATVNITVPSNSVTYVGMSAELQNVGAYTAGYAWLNFNGIESGNTNLRMSAADGDPYLAKNYPLLGIHSAQSGTGAKTLKAVFGGIGGTVYIKNVYLTAVNIPL